MRFLRFEGILNFACRRLLLLFFPVSMTKLNRLAKWLDFPGTFESYLRSQLFLSVGTTRFLPLLQYRGLYQGPRFNSVPADALHRSSQFVQGEVTVPGSHADHCGRTPADYLGDLRDGNSCVQHPRYRCVSKIVEPAMERPYLIGLVFFALLFILPFHDLGSPPLRRFPSFLDASYWFCRVDVVSLGRKLVTSSPYRSAGNTWCSGLRSGK
jgi:hypothetical protein